MPDRPLDVVTGLLEFVGVAVLALTLLMWFIA